MTMKNAVFWKSMLHTVFLRSVRLLLVTANVVPSPPIFVTLTMEALRRSETSAPTLATQRSIPEDGILLIFCTTLLICKNAY
jgi:hypothetical protein